MQPGLPPSILGKIEFFEQRVADWASDPDAIGLTAQQVADLIARANTARNDYNAAQQIRQQSRNATASQNQSVGDMARFGSDLIATVRAFADLQPDPTAVYNRAELDMPKPKGGPLPPPVPATNVRTQMDNTGAITVRWNGTVANGTVYAVYRRFAQGMGYTQIGTATTKSFVDNTVPVGTPEASYYVVTLRDGMQSGPSEAVNIRFGRQIQPGGSTNSSGQTASGESELGLAA
ncbi:MAG: hypothetical protein AAF937_05765 [Planctomycetota bacterium]